MSVAELEARELELEPTAGRALADAFRRLRRNPSAIVGFVLVAIFVFVAIFAPLIAPYDPREQNLDADRGRLLPGAVARSTARRRRPRARRALAHHLRRAATRS